MPPIILAPETRSAVSNVQGLVMGLQLTAKAISFDAGAADGIIISLSNGQPFLLKKGFSQRNDTAMHITGFRTVSISAVGVVTTYPSDTVYFTFGDALPTLGPQDVQFGGLVVTPAHALPVMAQGTSFYLDTQLVPTGGNLPKTLAAGGQFAIAGGSGIMAAIFGSAQSAALANERISVSALRYSLAFTVAAPANTILSFDFGGYNNNNTVHVVASGLVAGNYQLFMIKVADALVITIYSAAASFMGNVPLQTINVPAIFPNVELQPLVNNDSGGTVTLTYQQLFVNFGAS